MKEFRRDPIERLERTRREEKERKAKEYAERFNSLSQEEKKKEIKKWFAPINRSLNKMLRQSEGVNLTDLEKEILMHSLERIRFLLSAIEHYVKGTDWDIEFS